MQKMIRYGIGLALLAFAATANVALAQSGSGGGSIGNDEKSLSGSRSAEPAAQARRSRPDADEPPRSSSRRSGGAGGSGGGGGGGNFDGARVVVSVGTTCSGSSMTAVVVSSGKIIGEGLTGTVNPNGFASSVGNYNGITVISSGHVSGRSGSGTFKRSDGCQGNESRLTAGEAEDL
jgi:hypothetical protein